MKTNNKNTLYGFMLVEALIALAIIVLALSMVYLAPSWMFKTANYAELEASLFDAANSFAEEIIRIPASKMGLVNGATETIKTIRDSSNSTVTFVCSLATESTQRTLTIGSLSLLGEFATITVYPTTVTHPNGIPDLSLEMTVAVLK
jgi:Tfp pilus assembly protein PilE